MEERTAEGHALPPVVYVRLAGLAYLFVILTGMLTTSLVDARIVVPGDSAATASNVIAHELLFRLGILATLLMYAGVVVISAALYIVLKAVDERIALLAMLFRMAEAVVGATTILFSFAALSLLAGADALSLPPPDARDLALRLLEVRANGLDLVLMLVGLGGAGFVYLFFKSRYVPRPLSAWGILTYVSMVVLASISIVFPQHPVLLETVLYGSGAVFEVVFGGWLLLRGARPQQ
jgi:hypothetical protein